MCFIELKYEEGKGLGIVVWWGLWGGRLSCPPPPNLLGGSWGGGAPHSRLGDYKSMFTTSVHTASTI